MQTLVNSSQERAVETNNQKEKKIGGKKTHTPKPEEHGDMPHHRQCPPSKYREDWKPKYHEE
jgi:hypothetical protein